MKEQPEETSAQVFGTGEKPSFEETWNNAVYFTKLLWTDYGIEYLKRAKKSYGFPYLIPRGWEQYATHDKFLKGTKLVLSSGRTRNTPFAQEVEKAYNKLKSDLIRVKIDELTCQVEGKEIPEETKKEAFLHDLLPIRNSNYKIFKPLLMDVFLQLYDQKPEQHEHLRKAVRGRSDLKDSGETNPAYKKEIKKSFADSVKSLANENSKVYGEN